MLIRGRGATRCGMPQREAVFVSLCMKENAGLLVRTLPLGEPKQLTPGEIDQARAMLSEASQDRTWDYRLARAGFAGL